MPKIDPPTDEVELDARAGLAARRWDLSTRQAEVLVLVTRGGSNKDVADALGCAEVTIEKHLTAIFRAARVRGRKDLKARVLAFEAAPTRLRARAASVASREDRQRCG